MINLIQKINRFRDFQTSEDQSLAGQVVVVAGASGHVGRAVAETLYQQGAFIVLFARRISQLKNAYAKYDQERILILAGDASKTASVKKLYTQTVAKFGRVDTLVNCIGIFSGTSLEKLKISEIQKVFDTNVKSLFLLNKYAVKTIKKNPAGGTIVNFGSRISRNPNISPNKTLYASTKYTVEGFCEALSQTVAKYGIRVICLMPATISTFATKQFFHYMTPGQVAAVTSFVIKMKHIDFSALSFKSIKQDI